MRHLHAHRRRKPVAHGAEAARRHPAVRLLELQELGRPHLVLADLGGDVDVVTILDELVEPLQRVLRLDGLVRGLVAQAVARLPLLDPLPPRLEGLAVRAHVLLLPNPDHVLEK